VVTKNVVAGQQGDAGSTVGRVSNFTQMRLSLQVDEMDVPKVQPGQQAKVMVWGESGRTEIPGEVSQIGAMGTQETGCSVNITISIENRVSSAIHRREARY
jgi:multidrug resistance efflux pump